MPAGVSRPSTALMTADAVGGVWTYALELARGLTGAGVRVVLAALGPAPSTSQRAEALATAGLRLVELGGPLDWSAPDEPALRPVAHALANLARSTAAEVVHLSSPALAALAAFDRPVIGVCHSCPASWRAAVRDGVQDPDLAWRRELLARGYRACDRLLAPSQAFADATYALYGVRPMVVWNGRSPSAEASTARRERFALTAGRLWDEAKGGAILDRAAALARTPLVALGPLAAPGGAPIRFADLKAAGAVSGEAAAGWMARAPVFVSAALYEPFGLAVLEAAQAGAALVLSDIPTFRELWNGAALFVAPGDAAGFARAIDGLMDDEAERTALAKRAVARAFRYGAEAMTAGVLDLYGAVTPLDRREVAA